MAASRISEPGTEYGPCAETCNHVDCANTRKMARAQCHYCEQEIGYETRFYIVDDNLVHASCHEHAIETGEYET